MTSLPGGTTKSKTDASGADRSTEVKPTSSAGSVWPSPKTLTRRGIRVSPSTAMRTDSTSVPASRGVRTSSYAGRSATSSARPTVTSVDGSTSDSTPSAASCGVLGPDGSGAFRSCAGSGSLTWVTSEEALSKVHRSRPSRTTSNSANAPSTAIRDRSSPADQTRAVVEPDSSPGSETAEPPPADGSSGRPSRLVETTVPDSPSTRASDTATSSSAAVRAGRSSRAPEASARRGTATPATTTPAATAGASQRRRRDRDGFTAAPLRRERDQTA